jgi:hypothetical protein
MVNMKITGASSLASCAFCGSGKPSVISISNCVRNINPNEVSYQVFMSAFPGRQIYRSIAFFNSVS